MKAFIFVLLALVAMVAANHNGRPGCQTDEEMAVREYRNNWDPTAFWVCETRNQVGVQHRCEVVHGTQLGFMQGIGCVPWGDWVWQPANTPPTRGW